MISLGDCSLTLYLIQTILSISSAPAKNTQSAIQAALWLWLHLLQFTASNQVTSHPAEDKLNKAFRPMPSGKVNRFQVLILRWALVPICLGVSSLYSGAVVTASAGLIACTIWYNELGAGNLNWFIKNLL